MESKMRTGEVHRGRSYFLRSSDDVGAGRLFGRAKAHHGLAPSLIDLLIEIHGKWLDIPTESAMGVPVVVDQRQVFTALGLSRYGLSRGSVGIREPISEPGVHVVPVAIAPSIIALVLVNVGRLHSDLDQQRRDFMQGGISIDVKVETRYAHLMHDDGINIEEASLWVAAEVLSLSRDAGDLQARLDDTEHFVKSICQGIQ